MPQTMRYDCDKCGEDCQCDELCPLVVGLSVHRPGGHQVFFDPSGLPAWFHLLASMNHPRVDLCGHCSTDSFIITPDLVAEVVDREVAANRMAAATGDKFKARAESDYAARIRSEAERLGIIKAKKEA